jgi:hypothetical protein
LRPARAPPGGRAWLAWGRPKNKKEKRAMATTKCDNCGHTYHWIWEDAFDKFGFGDGDGQIETWRVRAFLEHTGYEVEELTWSLHNVIIISIKKDGTELIPESAAVGYDDPRGYLPAGIIEALDREFPPSNPHRKAGAK